jgi:hypothetical protein
MIVNSCMHISKAVALIAASLMLVCGCDNGSKGSSCVEGKVAAGGGVAAVTDVAGGGKITIEKKTAERSCTVKIAGVDRPVSFTASMEYPMHFGIPIVRRDFIVPVK